MRRFSFCPLAALAACAALGCSSGASSRSMDAAGAAGAGGTPAAADSSVGTGTADASADAAVVPTVGSSCDNVPASALVSAWTADPHFCMIRYATAVPYARQMVFAPNGDLIVDTATGSVVVLFDDDGNGVSDANERSTFAGISGGGTHGIALTATHLYASSPTTVYRWTYKPGQRSAAAGSAETVVQGIEATGHVTRTLLIDAQNRLYVNIGSATNVDGMPGTTPSSARGVIRRYDLGAIPPGGYPAAGGELFAAGLRNEVGLSLDSQGRLWGVENGRDDLPGGARDDNPAEEVNLFDLAHPGRAYGYPFCWSEGVWSDPAAKGTGTQHLDPDNPGGFTEAMCQNPSLVVPPVLGLRAHLAPFDIVEYTGSAYPAEFRGNFFVTSHGSWDRTTPVGRLILRLRASASGPTQAENFLGELNAGALREGVWELRPVSVRVDPAGLLTFTDDLAGTVNKIGYRP